MKREIVVDGRGLEPPEPMERVLLALAGLRPGECVRFLIHREPVPLYSVLHDGGHAFAVEPLADGGYQLRIEAPAKGG